MQVQITNFNRLIPPFDQWTTRVMEAPFPLGGSTNTSWRA